MFDYMLMGKPCFLYTTDLATYRTNDRGFYYDIRTTPFPLAEDQDELHQLIANFDMRRYRRGVRRFMQDFGFCEDGKAAERVVAWIENLRGKPSGS